MWEFTSLAVNKRLISEHPYQWIPPRSFIAYGCLLFVILCLVACSHGALTFQFHAEEKLNPNQHQQSLPVLVRVYQLSEDNHFRSATFSQLWKQDETFLGKDLICSNEFYLNPGAFKKISLDHCKGVQYIGIFALFRHSQKGRWKVIMPIKSHRVLQHFYLNLSNNQIEEVD